VTCHWCQQGVPTGGMTLPDHTHSLSSLQTGTSGTRQCLRRELTLSKPEQEILHNLQNCASRRVVIGSFRCFAARPHQEPSRGLGSDSRRCFNGERRDRSSAEVSGFLTLICPSDAARGARPPFRLRRVRLGRVRARSLLRRAFGQLIRVRQRGRQGLVQVDSDRDDSKRVVSNLILWSCWEPAWPL
jgi:hypothetical protein